MSMRSYLSVLVFVKAAVVAVAAVVVLTVLFLSPPGGGDRSAQIVTVEEGDTLADIAERMEEEGVVRSPFWFRVFVILNQGEHSIKAGDYYFSEPMPVYTVARRVSDGEFGLRPLRITVFEGWNLFTIADHLEYYFDNFDREEFFSLAREGYLFPDTYFFSPTASTEQLVRTMKNNFANRISTLESDIVQSGRTLEEIIIMASILETEANTIESKRKIADILWRRLEIDMPLQVDASFVYVNNKTTYDLTLDDLQIDNPYNTYRFTGLPPTPIANPGMNAIRAALDPIENEYWYFLSDLSSNMYYARDFDGHQYNRANFLRQ